MNGDAVIAMIAIRLSSPVRYENGRKASINKIRDPNGIRTHFSDFTKLR
jgi:hypothetical protein